MRSIVTTIIIIVAIIAVVLVATQYSRKPAFKPGIAETAGADLDRGAENAADAARRATNKAGEAIEKVGEKLQD